MHFLFTSTSFQSLPCLSAEEVHTSCLPSGASSGKSPKSQDGSTRAGLELRLGLFFVPSAAVASVGEGGQCLHPGWRVALRVGGLVSEPGFVTRLGDVFRRV